MNNKKKGLISTSLAEFKYPMMCIHKNRFHVRSCDIIVTIQTIDKQSYGGRIFNSWTEYGVSNLGTN